MIETKLNELTPETLDDMELDRIVKQVSHETVMVCIRTTTVLALVQMARRLRNLESACQWFADHGEGERPLGPERTIEAAKQFGWKEDS